MDMALNIRILDMEQDMDTLTLSMELGTDMELNMVMESKIVLFLKSKAEYNVKMCTLVKSFPMSHGLCLLKRVKS